jgi:hypothetical protein
MVCRLSCANVVVYCRCSSGSRSRLKNTDRTYLNFVTQSYRQANFFHEFITLSFQLNRPVSSFLFKIREFPDCTRRSDETNIGHQLYDASDPRPIGREFDYSAVDRAKIQKQFNSDETITPSRIRREEHPDGTQILKTSLVHNPRRWKREQNQRSYPPVDGTHSPKTILCLYG